MAERVSDEMIADLLADDTTRPTMRSMAQEISERRAADKTRLAEFGLLCLMESRDNIGDDLDGGFIQDTAEAMGLLARHPVTEPCCSDCPCADYGDFPQECLRYAPDVQVIVNALPAPPNGAKG